MKKTKLTLASSTIYQLEAGEQKAIRDGGDLYICVQSEDGIESSDDAPEEKPASSRTASPAQAPAKAEAPAVVGQLTEAQMTKMPTAELLDICAEMGIDPNKYEGQNTNKKVRLLILDAYANGEEAEEEEEEETAEIADDTTARPRRGATPAPAPAPTRAPRGSAPKSDEPEEIPREEWDGLAEGTMVLARLKMDTEEESAKLWEAQVTGWDTPKGVKDEKLFILFSEDGQEDYLRDEDRLYVYKKQL